MIKNLILGCLLIVFSSLNAQKIAVKKIGGDPFFNFNNFILLENGEKSIIVTKFKVCNLEYLA